MKKSVKERERGRVQKNQKSLRSLRSLRNLRNLGSLNAVKNKNWIDVL